MAVYFFRMTDVIGMFCAGSYNQYYFGYAPLILKGNFLFFIAFMAGAAVLVSIVIVLRDIQ